MSFLWMGKGNIKTLEKTKILFIVYVFIFKNFTSH